MHTQLELSFICFECGLFPPTRKRFLPQTVFLQASNGFPGKARLKSISQNKYNRYIEDLTVFNSETEKYLFNKSLNTSLSNYKSNLYFNNNQGENIDLALPSTPVEILGMNNSALAGDDFLVVDSEEKAKEIEKSN